MLPKFQESHARGLAVATQVIHVAILDDEASIRGALSRLLMSPEMVVDTYATADLFFDSLASKIPHCLVLDLQMPKISGLDVLKYLSQRHIHIPTIIITGHDEKHSREACMNAGAVAYLLKPLDVEILVDMIEHICRKP